MRDVFASAETEVNSMYEKLSKRALYCMYVAGIITGAVVLAVIGAVDYFWIFPENITVGKWISLAVAVDWKCCCRRSWWRRLSVCQTPDLEIQMA